MLKVAGKTAWNLAGKSCWYYPLVGALPFFAQEWIGKKLGDNPVSYTKANMAAETIVSPLAAAYITYLNTQNYAATIAVSSMTLLLSAVFNYGIRKHEGTKKFGSNKEYEEPAGSILLCTPLYVSATAVVAPFSGLYYLYVGGKKAIGAVQDTYRSIFQQEQQKLLQAKIRVEQAHQQEYDQAGVRVVTSASIEKQPEILLTPEGEKSEYDEDLIGESKRKELKRWP